MIKQIISNSEDDSYEIGSQIASKVNSGDVFAFTGSLGAGKSVVIRGIMRALGVDSAIPSPTFTIVNEYSGNLKMFHFDLYRIDDPYELYEIGFEEYVYSDAVSFIEWPEKAGELLPVNHIKIDIEIQDEKRIITINYPDENKDFQ